MVEDDGPGIPPDALERIFERFYTDRPEQGFGQNSGLGLSISRQIVEAHGGTIRAENRLGPPDATASRGGSARASSSACRRGEQIPGHDESSSDRGRRRRNERHRADGDTIHASCVVVGEAGDPDPRRRPAAASRRWRAR